MRTKTIEMFIDEIRKANKIVVLTGAGMSTVSGIPDLRSSEGLYKKYPSDILSLESFERDTEMFYEAYFESFHSCYTASPSKGHEILAKWEKEGKVQGIITQNVDGLHQKAGSKNIVEYHGDVWKYYRYSQYNDITLDIRSYEDLLDESGQLIYELNGDIYKPNIVLFGENVRNHNKAANMVTEADLLLILGTQLTVNPFAGLPSFVTKNNVKSLVINKGEIDCYLYQHYQLYEDIDEVLELIDKAITKQKGL